MSVSLRFGRFAAAVFAALALTGCAAMHVGSYLERGADFTRYRTYNWGPADRLSTGDPRLDGNPFFHDRVRADVERVLATRGFEKTASATPEVLVYYHTNVTQQLLASDIDRPIGDDRHDDSRAFVYEGGTLVVDLVDARTNSLIWRGWAKGRVEGVIDNQEWMEQKIDEAITRILERLPRRL